MAADRAADVAARGDLDTLLKFGDLSELLTEDQDTVMHVAVKAGQLKVVEFLLERYPQFATASNIHGHTVLKIAVQFYRLDIVCKLIAFSSNLIDFCGRISLTPLQYACWRGRWESAAIMIAAKPESVYQLDGDNRNLLHFGALSGDVPTVRYLLTVCPSAFLKTQNRLGITPLYFAIPRSSDVSKMIANADPTAIHIPGATGWLPLFFTTCYATLECILHIDPNASKQRATHDNKTLLHVFLERPSVDFFIEATKLLVQLNPDILNDVDNNGDSVLDIAFRLRDQTKINIIFQCKPDVQDTKRFGNTLLHIAACGGDCTIVERLFLTNSFALYHVNDEQKNPLAIAVEFKHTAVVQMFQPHVTIDMAVAVREECLANCGLDLYSFILNQSSVLQTYLLPELTYLVLEFFGSNRKQHTNH